MRLRSFGVSLLLAVVACAAPAADEDADDGDVGESGAALSADDIVPCALGRSQILASVSGPRRAAILRGFGWLDAHVPYSQVAMRGGYRTDCSGFVSMCWGTEAPGETTSSFVRNRSEYTVLPSYDNLVPGDALVLPGTHIVMFLGWNDRAHTDACVIEEANEKLDMKFRIRAADTLKANRYKPLRFNRF